MKNEDSSAKKRRRVSARHEEQAILTSLAASESRDYDYISDTLKARPDLTTYIARLLRDGALDKALNSRSQPIVPDTLGKKLPPRCKRLRNLAPKFVTTLLDDFAGAQITVPSNADGSLGKPLGRELQLEMLQFALHASLDTPLPTQHRSAGYEGPLQSVLRRRYIDMGGRLRGKTANDFKNGNFGYFVWSPTDAIRVTLLTGEKVSLNISVDFISQVSDWRVQDGWKVETSTLRSDSMDAAINLWPKVKQQFPDSSLLDLASEIEYPDAANAFPLAESVNESTPTSPAASIDGGAGRGSSQPSVAVRAGARSSVEPVPPTSS